MEIKCNYSNRSENKDSGTTLSEHNQKAFSILIIEKLVGCG